jgi:hypothetical protein
LLGDEVTILQMHTGLYYGLDPVGTHVWNLIRQPRAIQEILETLLAEYEVEPANCEADLLALLENLRKENLIEVQDAGAV